MEDTLLSKIQQNKVIAYMGPFGTGKTTTLKKYFDDHEDEIEPIFFNAWEFDYAENAKSVFIHEVFISIFQKLGLKDKSTAYLKRGLKLIKNIIINKIGEELPIEGTDKEFISMINNYKTEHKMINELKSLIQDIVKDEGKNIVLIIDDLDRSRPDFALEIFEISKHIFDVDNLSIILVYDENIMENTIQNKYGAISGEGYLNKYVDFKHYHNKVRISTNLKDFSIFDFIIDNWNDDISIRTIRKFKDTYGNSTLMNEWSISAYTIAREVLFFIKMIEPKLLEYQIINNTTILWNEKDALIEFLEKYLGLSMFDHIEIGLDAKVEEILEGVRENDITIIKDYFPEIVNMIAGNIS